MRLENQGREFVWGPGLIVLIVCSVVWIYYKALNGPFLFDDYPNLEKLVLINGSVTWENVLLYLSESISGPAGRPISMLTFLLNALDWPADPWPFKYTNVLIHALNAFLVFWFLHLVTRRALGATSGVALLSGLMALAWALSPYHVSTVLYVVQRMAMLSALFVLFGLILYFKGRLMLDQERPRTGIMVVVMAYIVGAGLGTMSKENAILFVLLVPLVDWLLFRARPAHYGSRVALRLILIVPALIFLIAFAVQWPSFSEAYNWKRDFSVVERLLTQIRALGYYAWRYLIPGTEYFGIYGDTFRKSTGLLEPVATLSWLCVHAILVVSAIMVRHRYPLVALGILFFYVAHILESSIVPLELFFEHRNYLPSVLLLLPIAALRNTRAVLILAIVCCANGAFLSAETHRWSDSASFYTSSVERLPESERAAVGLAGFHMSERRFDQASDVLRDLQHRKQIGLSAGLALITNACSAGEVRPEDVEAFVASPQAYRGLPSILSHIGLLARRIQMGDCPGLQLGDLRQFLEVYLSAFDRGPKAKHAYHRALFEIESVSGRASAAEVHGLAALRAYPNLNFSSQFCRSLIQSRSANACECLRISEDAFEEGYEKTIIRYLLGYSETRHEAYERVKRRFCGSVARLGTQP